MKRLFQHRLVWAGVSVVLAAGLWGAFARGQNVGKAEYEVYRCQHKSAAEVERLLRDLLPDDASVHLVVDSPSNTLLLRGGAEAQRIAVSLLQHVDRPSEVPVAAQPPAPTVVKAYACPPGQLDQYLAAVRALCGTAANVKVTAAREANQLYVVAPQELHEQITQRLSQRSVAAAGADESAAAPRRLPAAPRSDGEPPAVDTPPAAIDPTAEVDRMLHLRFLPASEVEQRLIALFGRRLHARQQDGQEVLVLPVGDKQALMFQLDATRSLVMVRGPGKLVEQFARLVDALDASGARGQQVRALHVERTSDAKLREAVEAYRGNVPAEGQRAPVSQDQSQVMRGGDGTQLVSYLFQQPPGAVGGAGAAVAGQEQPDASQVPGVTGLNDLEVQTLPDLDVIILRGRDQDVEQLTEIIRELERLSAETVPKISIYQLRHAPGEAIEEIISQVEQEYVGRRQGRVTVLPLVKPNALLLIGWGEAVEAMIELIQKLDQPVPPETEFAVFPLKHAAATTVQQTLTQFFTGRDGLGPRVRSAVDARTNSLIVYAAPRDMAEVQRLIGELDVTQGEAVNRARIFRIENALATDVADTLEQAIQAAQTGQGGRAAVLELLAVDDKGQEVIQSGMLTEVSITPNPRNNTLIVTGPPGAMGLIEALIEQLDTPGDRAQIKVFRIINGDATNLVTMLQSLIPSQFGQAALGPQLPSAPEEQSLVPLRFSVEVRSNSIIAVGSEGDLRIVEALITRLDQSESMNRENAVYLLKNAPAIDVAASINEFLRSQRTLEAAQPGQSNPFQDLEREVIVVPEPVGNRLIVSATPRYFDEITQLIEKLDEPPAQVVIQILIAEVMLGDRDELGVELGLQDSVLFDRSLLGDLLTTINTVQVSDPSGIVTTTQEIIQAATNTPGYDFNNKPLGNSGSDKALAGSKNFGGQALSSFMVGRDNKEAGFGGLVLSASSRNIGVLIRALQEDRETRILSRPLVRTLDNQPAFIQVGQRVPRIVGTTLGNFGQQNQIDLENVGLILGVTPRISPDGQVVMEIDAEKSKVGPEEEGVPVGVSIDGEPVRSPRIDTITAQATVSVADGETVVLGGMITRELETVERRAPYLADIPILGHLFRYDQSYDRRAEMIIILTPRVIRNPSDAERIKQAEFARMSWCAADVYDIYGDIGMDFHTRMTPPDADAGTEVIYPDVNPRGEPTQQPIPAPSPDFNGMPGQLPLEPGQPDHTPPPPPPPFTPQGRRDDSTPWIQPGQAWGAPALNAPVANPTLPLSQNFTAPAPGAPYTTTGNTPLTQPSGYPQTAWGTPPNAYNGTTR